MRLDGLEAGMSFSLDDLARSRSRRDASAAGETPTRKSLFEAGLPRIAKKFGEEAVEAVIAAMRGRQSRADAEAADVLYHLLVLLEARGVTLDEFLANWQRRTSQSGLEEKAARERCG